MEMEWNNCGCCWHCQSSDKCIRVSEYFSLKKRLDETRIFVENGQTKFMENNIIIFGCQMACLHKIKPVHTDFGRRKEWSFHQMRFAFREFEKNLFLNIDFFPSFFHYFIRFRIRYFLCALLWNEKFAHESHECITRFFAFEPLVFVFHVRNEMKRREVLDCDFGRKEVFIWCQTTIFGWMFISTFFQFLPRFVTDPLIKFAFCIYNE